MGNVTNADVYTNTQRRVGLCSRLPTLLYECPEHRVIEIIDMRFDFAQSVSWFG